MPLGVIGGSDAAIDQLNESLDHRVLVGVTNIRNSILSGLSLKHFYDLLEKVLGVVKLFVHRFREVGITAEVDIVDPVFQSIA